MNYRQKDAVGILLLSFGAMLAFYMLLIPILNHAFWHGWLSIVLVLIGVLIAAPGIVLRRKAMAEYQQHHEPGEPF